MNHGLAHHSSLYMLMRNESWIVVNTNEANYKLFPDLSQQMSLFIDRILRLYRMGWRHENNTGLLIGIVENALDVHFVPNLLQTKKQ